VESVIALAHRLGLQVVAEGVETTKVWTILRDLGCDVAQGFGIAHPMPLPDLKGWLTAWNEVQIEQMGRRGDHLAGVREPRPTR
jgi:EAL domain-containing protein (putative c-di-GMP-specific phosphodiesterase class I)